MRVSKSLTAPSPRVPAPPPGRSEHLQHAVGDDVAADHVHGREDGGEKDHEIAEGGCWPRRQAP